MILLNKFIKSQLKQILKERMFIVLRPTTRQQHNKLLQMYIFPITQHIYYHNFKSTLSHQQQ